MRWLIVGGIAIGCNPPGLAPTSPVADDARVLALPDHMTVVGGIDLPTAAAHPAIGERLLALDALGVPGGAWGIDHLVVGCGDHGCVGLADGSLDELSLTSVRGLPSRATARGERLRGPGGWDGRLLRLGEGKIALGDAAAVRDVAQRNRAGSGRTDGAWLRDLVPEGPIWLAATDPTRLRAQASDWVGAHAGAGLPQLDALLELLDRHQGAAEAAGSRVEALALAVDLERERAVLRVRTRDEGTARQLALLARARLAITPLPQGLTQARVAREGRQVELQLAGQVEVLLARSQGGAAAGGDR